MIAPRQLVRFWVCGCGGLAAGALCAQEPALDALPRYAPEQKISGVIRNYGNAYAGLLKRWEDAFRKIHPDISFADTLPTSDAAFPALITGVTDLAPDGSEPIVTETLGFFEVYGYHATAITVASGTFDEDGRSPGPVVFVHPDNPITKLTLRQRRDKALAEQAESKQLGNPLSIFDIGLASGHLLDMLSVYQPKFKIVLQQISRQASNTPPCFPWPPE